MKREFGIGDIAHIDKGMRVNGILNYDTTSESYKKFNVKYGESIRIIGYRKIAERFGCYGYDGEIEKDNVVYRVCSIAQVDLISKASWKKKLEQDELLDKLLKEV